MKRQTIIWAIIGALFVGLIIVKATLGGGMGRVYVEARSVAFEVTPAERAPWADPDSPLPPPAVKPIPVPADALDRHGVWTEQDGAVVGWTAWHEVTPKVVFEARAQAAKAAESGDAGAAAPSVSAPTAPVYRLSWARTAGLWLAALFTLAIFSFLYRDNPFYKVAESVVVGCSAAYYMVVGFWDVLVPKLFGRLATGFVRDWVQPTLKDPELPDRIAMVAAAILGAMLLMQLVRKVRWMSMWPLAFVIGTFAGLKLYTYIESDLLGQLRAATSASPLVIIDEDPTGQSLTIAQAIWQSFLASLRPTLLLIGTACTIFYFFFSLEHKGAAGRVARVGIWFLMITFGAAFGTTVMGRVTLLSKRFEFLFDDWLWLIDPKNMHTLTDAAASAVSVLLGSGP